MNEHPTLISLSLNSFYAQFLEQLSDEQFWDHAFERAHATPTAHVQTDEYLVCELGNGSSLLPLAALREVLLTSHQFTLLPDAPFWMLGLSAWHGETIAVVDLSAYLFESVARSLTVSTSLVDATLLIAQHDTLTLGLFVSTSGSTTTVEVEQMTEQIPAWCSSLRTGVIKGIYRERVVLDLPAILTDMVRRIGKTTLYE